MGKTMVPNPTEPPYHQGENGTGGIGGGGGVGGGGRVVAVFKKGDGRISFVNFVVIVLCISSLGASIYSNFRQSHIEDRIRHLRHLDDRISMMEAKLSAASGVSQYQQSASLGSAEEFSDVANVVRKLSLQVAGIQRLRRDVSHLQLTRRANRQASIQQSPECVCPPGKQKRQF